MPKNSTAVAMGLFDGVHYGHRTVIRYAVDIAQRNIGVDPAVFTFDTDTVTSKGNNGVECLISRDMKRDLIEELGVKYIYSPDFMNFKNLSTDDFVDLVLCDKMAARFVICGHDFRFGKFAAGDVDELDRLCRKRGIKVNVVPPVIEEQGERISSTMIRQLIREGNIEEANRLLGYQYQMRLPVAYGHQIGRTIGFPTINQYLPKRQVVPKFGVYASKVEFGNNVYRGITNIGIKPTVANTDTPIAETYIIGFDGDLYCETVRLSLISFIRPERKFDSIPLLAEQIRKDVELCKAIPNSKYLYYRDKCSE